MNHSKFGRAKHNHSKANGQPPPPSSSHPSADDCELGGDASKSANHGGDTVRQHINTNVAAWMPESALFILIGLVFGAIFLKTQLFGYGQDEGIRLNPEIVMTVMLPPIVLQAGYSVDKNILIRNLWTVLTFAILGTVLNAAMLAPLFYFGAKSHWALYDNLDLSLVESCLFAVIICAVDPVAVLAIFESMHVNQIVYTIVFGESLLNDGVAVTLVNSFKQMGELQQQQPTGKQANTNVHNFGVNLSIALATFVYAFCVSLANAFLFAGITAKFTKWFFHAQRLQSLAILLINYLCYLNADALNGSGILALFFCALLQRQFVEANLTYESHITLSTVVSLLSQICENFIFVLMGLTALSPDHGLNTFFNAKFTFYVIGCCYVTRFIVIYLLGFLLNMGRTHRLSYMKSLFLQAHGGLRGAIGFALVLNLNRREFLNQAYFESTIVVFIFISVFVIGCTIKPLIFLLSVPRESNEEKTVFKYLNEKIIDSTLEAITYISEHKSFQIWIEFKYRQFNNKYLKPFFIHKEAMERNVTASGLVKLYRKNSIAEAQEMAASHGSLVYRNLFDGAPSDRSGSAGDAGSRNGSTSGYQRDARLNYMRHTLQNESRLEESDINRMIRRGSESTLGGTDETKKKSSVASHLSICDNHAEEKNKFHQCILGNSSVPDFAMLDMKKNVKDSDDAMARHYSHGLHPKKKLDRKKLKKTRGDKKQTMIELNNLPMQLTGPSSSLEHICNHHCTPEFGHPHRTINLDIDRLNESKIDGDELLARHIKKFGPTGQLIPRALTGCGLSSEQLRSADQDNEIQNGTHTFVKHTSEPNLLPTRKNASNSFSSLSTPKSDALKNFKRRKCSQIDEEHHNNSEHSSHHCVQFEIGGTNSAEYFDNTQNSLDKSIEQIKNDIDHSEDEYFSPPKEEESNQKDSFPWRLKYDVRDSMETSIQNYSYKNNEHNLTIN